MLSESYLHRAPGDIASTCWDLNVKRDQAEQSSTPGRPGRLLKHRYGTASWRSAL
jgi:hypothetical protein